MDLPGDKNRFTRAVEDFHGKTVPQLRTKFIGGNDLDSLLEHHARAFVLDELLDATGWVTRPGGGDHVNLLTEAYFRKGYLKTRTLFFDYLGVDRLVNLPLLVLEAKRFGAARPRTLVDLFEQRKMAKASSKRKTKMTPPLAEVLAAAMKLPTWVQGEWRDHIKQLKKYLTATKAKFKRPPAVLAIGNGEWLLIIREPEQVFSGQTGPDSFLVIDEPGLRPGEAYRKNFDEIHRAIAYERLAPASSHLSPEAIPEQLLEDANAEIMRGVYLGYTSTSTPQRRGARPHIDVTPMVFVRAPMQTWLSIRTEADGKTLPHESRGSAALELHLAEMAMASGQLMDRVKRRFTHSPTEVDLVTHGKDATALVTRPFVLRESAVAETSTQSFIIVTGKNFHFLLPQPRVTCPYHEWSKCDDQSVGQFPSGAPVAAPSFAGNRAFFPNGRTHHCAADVTYRTKAAQVLVPSVAGSAAQALNEEVFCKIFEFESMLCCQTCAFFEVCAAARTFILPCMPRPAVQPAP